MTDPLEPAEDAPPADRAPDDDAPTAVAADDAAGTPDPPGGERKVWSSEELAQLAKRMLERRNLADAVESAFTDHPDLSDDAVEYVDDDELKP